MEFTSEFSNWIKEQISAAFERLEETSIAPEDLVSTLFSSEINNNAITGNKNDAIEFIVAHWDDSGKILANLKDNYGLHLNPFEEPENFQLNMLLAGARASLNECETVKNHPDAFLELFNGDLDKIKSELEINESQRIEALLIKPSQEPVLIQVKTDLESLQSCVEGNIEVVHPYDDENVAYICNEEGKVNGLPLNRTLYDSNNNMYDIIAGNFIVVGLTEDDFTSLTPELAEKYSKIFQYVEDFVDIGGKILTIKEIPSSLDSEFSDAISASDELKDTSLPHDKEMSR